MPKSQSEWTCLNAFFEIQIPNQRYLSRTPPMAVQISKHWNHIWQYVDRLKNKINLSKKPIYLKNFTFS
jgi:hypothetical protein